MSYIKLTVRSGGIYLKQNKDEPLNLKLTDHPTENNQKVLSLVRESSIKGLFSYLIGETKKIKNIEKDQKPLIKKLNSTLDAMLKASAYKKKTEVHVTSFFERRDIHNKESEFIPNPKVSLANYSFKEADPTIKLLEAPLRNIMNRQGELSLLDINSFFVNSNITYDKNKEEYEKLQKRTKEVRGNLKKIPDGTLKKGIVTALKRIDDQKPISTQVIKLIKEICNLCDKDKNFSKEIKESKYGKFSIFTELKKTTQWVNKTYHPIVRGTPAHIACVDFDIYLSKEDFVENVQNQNSEHFTWEEILCKLKNGPNIGRWGEGGIVLLDYSGLDEMGRDYDQKDQMFVEIKTLRWAGLKIKKYDWEPQKDKKNKKAG